MCTTIDYVTEEEEEDDPEGEDEEEEFVVVVMGGGGGKMLSLTGGTWLSSFLLGSTVLSILDAEFLVPPGVHEWRGCFHLDGITLNVTEAI